MLSAETTTPGAREGDSRPGALTSLHVAARYTKIDSGYLGQLVEWPEVVTEGVDVEECRSMLRDALQEMILAYQQQGKEIPLGTNLFEPVSIDLDYVRQTA